MERQGIEEGEAQRYIDQLDRTATPITCIIPEDSGKIPEIMTCVWIRKAWDLITARN